MYAEALSARSVVSVACWVGVFVFFWLLGSLESLEIWK